MGSFRNIYFETFMKNSQLNFRLAGILNYLLWSAAQGECIINNRNNNRFKAGDRKDMGNHLQITFSNKKQLFIMLRQTKLINLKMRFAKIIIPCLMYLHISYFF